MCGIDVKNQTLCEREICEKAKGLPFVRNYGKPYRASCEREIFLEDLFYEFSLRVRLSVREREFTEKA